jgi:hypothetical protein
MAKTACQRNDNYFFSLDRGTLSRGLIVVKDKWMRGRLSQDEQIHATELLCRRNGTLSPHQPIYFRADLGQIVKIQINTGEPDIGDLVHMRQFI